MKTKKQEQKICAICNKEIKPNDNYCRLTDYKQGQFHMESFYHTSCFNDKIKGGDKDQVKMKRAAMSMLQRAGKLLNRAEGKSPDEVYEVVS